MHLDHLTPGTARVLLVLVWVFAVQGSATAAVYSGFEPQHLKVLAKGSTLEISWESTQGHLESSSGPNGPWEALTNRAAFTDGRSVVTVPRDSGPRFYRLRQETFRAMTYNIHHGVGTDGVLNLMFDALSSCDWIGAARGQIDELKETQAAVLRIKYGLSTHEDELQRLGKDYRRVYAQLQREMNEREERGIVLYEDNSVNAASGATREADGDGNKDSSGDTKDAEA